MFYSALVDGRVGLNALGVTQFLYYLHNDMHWNFTQRLWFGKPRLSVIIFEVLRTFGGGLER